MEERIIMKNKINNKEGNWQQWIPVYGIYRMMKDNSSIANEYPNAIPAIYVGYQSIATAGIIVVGLIKGLEKIL